MPIKSSEVLSRADFDEAVVRLRLNVSEIAKEVGVPRTYLSEFRNGDRKLRLEHQAKLRDYFESKGIEFEDESAADPEQEDGLLVSPHPRVAAVQSVRCYFPVSEDVSDEVVQKTLNEMDAHDARLAELLKQQVALNNGFFGGGRFTAETEAALNEAGIIMAANYLLFRKLSGWRVLGTQRSQGDAEKLLDLILDNFAPQLEAAGFLAIGNPNADDSNADAEHEAVTS